MNVYQLKNLPEQYQTFDLDLLELCYQLGSDELMARMLNAKFSCEPLASYWGKISHHFGSPLASVTAIPDVSLWGSNFLVLNQKAYDALAPAVQGEGEFLAITANGDQYHVFNCLSYAKEDESLTEKQYLDGYEDGLKSLAFDKGSTANRYLFKSQIEGSNRLFASQSFEDLCTNANLSGLRFDSDLLNDF